MDYELAKRLKDAGFPQGGDSDWYFLNGEEEPHTKDMEAVYSEEVYIPTLSELIEACGDRFGYLKKVNTEKSSEPWVAFDHIKLLGEYGTTPEEAVANLWLAMNEK